MTKAKYLGFGAIVFFVFCLRASGTLADLTRVKVGILPSESMSSTYIAKEAGFFRKNGLEVDLTYFTGGVEAVQSMLSGELPLTVTAGPEGVIAKVQGADLVILSTNIPTLAYTLFVLPNIRTGSDLRGKKIGISRFGSSSDFTARYMVQRLGLDPSKDVTIMQIGELSSRLAAMKTNSIQGTVLIPPTTVLARRAGFVVLSDAMGAGLKYHAEGIATTGGFLKNNREIVERFFKGFLEGTHYAKTHTSESIQLIKNFLKLSDEQAAEETYRAFILELLPRKPYPIKEGVETILSEIERKIPKAKQVRAEELIDPSIMKQLDESGFIDDLYR